ncbi:MAG: translation initiation factor IF-5A [Candidatus Aenigmatarchaeota archaeon]
MKTTASITRLKPGGMILIDDIPCKVEKVQSSSSGKHGHAKVRVDAVGLLDGKRRSIVKPSGGSVDVPILNKNTAQVLAVTGDTAQLMDTTTFEMFELHVPDGMKGTLVAGSEIQYFEIMGVKTLQQVK